MTPRLYLNFKPNDSIISLDRKQINYLKNVLRLKDGCNITIFNGKDGEYNAIFKQDSSNYFFTISHQNKAFTKPQYLSLCYAPVKNVKTDFIAKKAAELGVTELQPITTQYTIVRKVNEEKLTLSMIEGIEQCGRIDLIDIKPILAIERYLKACTDTIILFFDESANGSTPQEISSNLIDLVNKKITILIGPEGGFSDAERSLINAHPTTLNISLGPRILRADTAIIAACTIINSYCRNWQ
ncbi:MAG: 16S rRNA (uracil(1498)-N(3))-methyltransferase [Rickettsiales bacterium]|nr:16S rRNA (uracil(1498)-N(3))-methyltransferase [Rickettsiales bacterium]